MTVSTYMRGFPESGGWGSESQNIAEKEQK